MTLGTYVPGSGAESFDWQTADMTRITGQMLNAHIQAPLVAALNGLAINQAYLLTTAIPGSPGGVNHPAANTDYTPKFQKIVRDTLGGVPQVYSSGIWNGYAVAQAGFYNIIGSIAVDPDSGTTWTNSAYLQLGITINGADGGGGSAIKGPRDTIFMATDVVGSAVRTHGQVTTYMYLNAGDVVRLWCYSSKGMRFSSAAAGGIWTGETSLTVTWGGNAAGTTAGA